MPSTVGGTGTSRLESSSDFAELLELLRLGGSAVVLDLEPLSGVRMAAEASHRGLAHVVLIVPRWPHAEAVLPTAELIATLLGESRRLRVPAATSNVVFVLDGEREMPLRRPLSDPRVDNRYALAVGDLPNLAALRAAGVQRLVKVSRSPGTT
jgi:hypothetical protein